MEVNSTDLKNNLGKYLRLCNREDIIITSNGRKVARLSSFDDLGTGGDVLREKVARHEANNKSYEEFLELTKSSDDRYEYIDGQIYYLVSPKTVHQKISGELYGLFYNWFKGKKCRPFFAPYDITLKRTNDDINVVQPDLMVICDLEENLNEKNYYMGVPKLLVEIISENTRSKDLIKKLDLYMSTDVGEYWIVNPLSQEVYVYLFQDQNISKNITYKDGETVVSFTFAGLKVELDTIFT